MVRVYCVSDTKKKGGGGKKASTAAKRRGRKSKPKSTDDLYDFPF